MASKTIILDSAKEEFKEIKRYVKKEFGDSVWSIVNAEYKEAIQRIKNNPQISSTIDELKDLGITNVRYTFVRQTRIVYEFDDDLVFFHMFIHTKRDFRAHLFKRLISQ